jgi:hypothetical protein
MPIHISSEIIKEIADYLDAGMLCFYHTSTGELEYYPDQLRGHADFDEEMWRDVIDKVEKNYDKYIRFEGMESRESFKIMEDFVAAISETGIRQRFQDAISFRRPFQNFKQLLHNYPVLQKQWFDYKNQQYMEWVQEQLENYDSSGKEE